jgi:transposase
LPELQFIEGKSETHVIMATNSAPQLVQKLWNYCNILRDDGLSYGDYVEQLTFLLFLKMADEQARPPFNKPSPIPKGKDWPALLQRFSLERREGKGCSGGMAAYSLDLRERIVEAVERQVGRKREIARLFGVHESFLYKLLRQQRERGDLAPLPHGGGAQAKLTAEQWQQVARWMEATPDATLAELQDQVQQKLRVRVGLSTVWRGVEALGVTRKKRASGPPKLTPKHGPPFKSSSRSCPARS